MGGGIPHLIYSPINFKYRKNRISVKLNLFAKAQQLWAPLILPAEALCAAVRQSRWPALSSLYQRLYFWIQRWLTLWNVTSEEKIDG